MVMIHLIIAIDFQEINSLKVKNSSENGLIAAKKKPSKERWK
jgi:hypothetical protein